MRLDRPVYRYALVFLVAVCTLLPLNVQAIPRAGQPVPGFKVVSTSGQTVSLDNYRGHVLVIDFFATWCPPCRESIPHLIEMNRKYGKQGLQILGLSLDEDGERVVRTFTEEHRINYPVALAGETVAVDFGIRSVPVMFVIDKKGRIAEIYRGFNDDIGRSMEGLVKKLLSEK